MVSAIKTLNKRKLKSGFSFELAVINPELDQESQTDSSPKSI